MHTARRRASLLVGCLTGALAAVLAVTAIVAPTAAAESNGLALTPPMGWNSWYTSYCGVSAQLVEQTAQAMVSDGMAAAGYDYVNIDDCWMAPSRDSAGNLVADPVRFPQGIKPVADYVHSLGLKLGIYEDAGTATCAHLPGSYGHESQDAAAFAAWGADLVKYDRCDIPFGDFPGQSPEQVEQTLFGRMSRALNATGRPMVFTISNADYGINPWTWARPIANSWRTTLDLEDNFGSMLSNFQGTVDRFSVAGPGGWNDPDLLQVGNGGSTPLEYRTEFSLWAEMAVPLIASTNLTALSPIAQAIFENRAVIAVDQDRLGRPGVPVSRANGLWTLTKALAGGDRAVVLFNSTNTAAAISTTAAAAGLRAAPAYRLENLWSGAVTESAGAIRSFVPAHGVVMYRVSRLTARRAGALPPQAVLSLAPGTPQLQLGGSTIVRETFVNDGVSPVKRLKLLFWVPPGWIIKRFGPARSPIVAPRRRFTVAFRVSAPHVGPPVATGSLTGAASYDPPVGRRRASVMFGEPVFAPVGAPFQTANTTTNRADFGASGGALAISSRGLGVYAPINAAPTDSYAALYEGAAAGSSSVAQVTVTSDYAGGTSGGAGLIERNAMTAPAGSPPGVVLYLDRAGTPEMAWNATGGRTVDSRYKLMGVVVTTPVSFRLVRSGSSYSGYYSTDQGATWHLVDTVTVAPGASTGNQDVGVFHASGIGTWTTTATFADFQVN